MFELALKRIAESSDLIILFCFIIFVLGLVIRVLWKSYQAKDKALAKTITSYSKKLEDKNDDILQALIANTKALESSGNKYSELRLDIKDLKNDSN